MAYSGVGLIKYILCIYASLIQFSNLHHICVWQDLLALHFMKCRISVNLSYQIRH